MAKFVINTPIETDAAKIDVEVDPANPMRLGRHRFQLVVVDDSGNQSAPDAVEVRVIDKDRPTAHLVAPDIVPFSTSFALSGENSIDVGGGRVVRYIWTYLGPVLSIPGIPIVTEPVTPITPIR